jgi:hypothetical protein
MEQKKPILKIFRQDFICWFFDEQDLKLLTRDILDDLLNHGRYSIDLNEVWKDTGYIPFRFITNKEVILKKHLTENNSDDGIEFPAEYYDAEFI